MSTKGSKQDRSTVDNVVESNLDEYRHMTYDEIIAASQGQGMDVVDGYALIEDKRELIKSPFIITAFTFRPSDVGVAEYVSLEVKSREFDNAVVNDGSTGIRRQIMKYCISKGWATLTEDGKEFLESSRQVEDSHLDEGDLQIDMYDWDLPAEVRFDPSGNKIVRVSQIFLHAPRGLRVSEYEQDDPENPGKKRKAKTFYLG